MLQYFFVWAVLSFLFSMTKCRVKLVRYEMVPFSLLRTNTHTQHTRTYSWTFIMCLSWQLSTRMCSNMLYRDREKERSEQYCRWVLMNSSSPGHTDTHTQTHSPAETAWHIALITWCIYCLLPMSLSNSWPIAGLHAGACQHLSSTVSDGSGILSQKSFPENFCIQLLRHVRVEKQNETLWNTSKNSICSEKREMKPSKKDWKEI